MMKMTTKEMVIAALLMAISVILSYPMFKVMGSIGFDAMPAYFGAALLGPVLGGIIGGFAHFVSALLTGFQMTLPIHLVVTLTMFLSCFAYGFARIKTNGILASLVGIVVNGPVSLAVAAAAAQALGAPFAGMPMFMTLLVPLTMTSAINVILAEVVFNLVGKRFERELKA